MKSLCTALLFLLFSIAGYGQYIKTIAGNGTIGYGGDNGPATNAQFIDARDIAVDNLGNVFVADIGSHSVRKIDFSGTITTVAGTNGTFGYSGDHGPATNAKLSTPLGIALDKYGNLYIAEEGNNVIRKVNTSGIITTVAGNNIAGFYGDSGTATLASFNRPHGVAVDKYGNLYVVDEYNYRIRKVDTMGIITTFAGNGASGYTGDNGPATTAELEDLNNITADTLGNIYFSTSGRIRKVDLTGTITTFAGNGIVGASGDGGPATSASLSVNGIIADINGNIFVADYYNYAVRVINNAGIINKLAGNYTIGFSGDGGFANLAQLAGPIGVAVDSSGSLYIVDNSNSRIRKTYEHTESVSAINSKDKEILIFPNPNTGSFTITLPSGHYAPTPISITNIIGQQIDSFIAIPGKPLQVEMQIPDGIYFMQYIYNGERVTEKMVVAH